ncbi:MAG TPA: PaaI family thioesterase [Thermoanaerobaculia bacterium]|nr:PaaI family thioesterase [Thermoanaerobaculia bacterium]
MEPPPDLVSRFAEHFRDHPVSRFLDFHIAEAANGRCVMTLEFRPEFDNSTGAVHGGILAMLADTAIACALGTMFEDMNFATANLNIHFLRKANTAVTATAQIIKKGGKVCVGTCEIHDPRGALVATVIADFVLHRGPALHPAQPLPPPPG